jgi:hydroxymethylpyrimidine/phosphomethylpyrimidine kinase
MEAPRIDSPNTHGTGCTLSSAIAAHLALGASLPDAVQQARNFVREALQAGAQVRTGKGSGPLNHGYAPIAMRPRKS